MEDKPVGSLYDYFIEHTDKRFDKIETKIDELMSFRWVLVGITIGASAAVSAIVTVIGLLIGGR